MTWKRRVRRCGGPSRARKAGEDYALLTYLYYLAATEELAGDNAAATAAMAEAGYVAARRTGRRPPGISSRAASC